MTPHSKTPSLIIRRVWILNFAAIVSSLIVLSWWMLRQVNLAKSDKDIILVYLVIVTGCYLVILTYLFFQKIYKWQRKGRTLYYVSASFPAIFSLIIFVVAISANAEFTMRLIWIYLFAGINVVTYIWGMVQNPIRT